MRGRPGRHGADPSLPCGSCEGVWTLSPMWWEHLKDFKNHDPICTVEDHRGNHVEAELEVLGLAAEQTEKSGGVQRPGGRDEPDLRQHPWGCKKMKREQMLGR